MPNTQRPPNIILGWMLVIQITGETHNFIAEVVQEKPLILKVQEDGPYSRLKSGDYIINDELSDRLQCQETEQALFEEFVAKGRPLVSGLESLGFKDGQLHEVHPVDLSKI